MSSSLPFVRVALPAGVALSSMLLSACATAIAPAQPPASGVQPVQACTGASCAADAPRLALYPADSLDAAAPSPAPVASTTPAEDITQPAIATGSSGYAVYTPQLLASYLGSAPVALYFHAPWCPKCIQLEKGLRSHPGIARATVLQADYDTEEQLRRAYRVSSQTTVVFFSADGSIHHTVINPTADEVVGFFIAL